jgi:hypothetical protein
MGSWTHLEVSFQIFGVICFDIFHYFLLAFLFPLIIYLDLTSIHY